MAARKSIFAPWSARVKGSRGKVFSWDSGRVIAVRAGEFGGAARRYCTGQLAESPSTAAAWRGQYGSRSISRARKTRSAWPLAVVALALWGAVVTAPGGRGG